MATEPPSDPTGERPRQGAAVHHHRRLSGGWARAAVFGVSDGLVSNVALILGVVGAQVDSEVVVLTGVAGLVAGALSMAAGEYVSVQAQRELVQRELLVEADSLRRRPEAEIAELAGIFEQRGVEPQTAQQVAREVMSDPAVALEVHAREEMGVDPSDLGSPVRASLASFASFAVGALVPLVPWLLAEGSAAVVSSLAFSAVAALLVGTILASFTGRSPISSALRQLLIAAAAAGATVLIGMLFDVSVSG